MRRIITAFAAALCLAQAAAAREYVTTQNAQHGHAEFVFQADGDDVPLGASNAAFMKAALENMVASGSKFKPGQTLLMGPVVLKVEAAEGGRLRLLEPDMRAMPFNYVDSVSRTLNLLRRQTETAKSVDALDKLSFAPLDEPLLLTPKALKAQAILMMRLPAGKGGVPGVGWILSDAQAEGADVSRSDLQAMSVYEAALERPEIADFMALPAGYSVVVIDRKRFLVFNENKPVQPKEGSYLQVRAGHASTGAASAP